MAAECMDWTYATAHAAAVGFLRDELWRRQPALAADCEHDMEMLPVVEFRLSIVCRKCGGLDADLSRAVQYGKAGWPPMHGIGT